VEFLEKTSRNDVHFPATTQQRSAWIDLLLRAPALPAGTNGGGVVEILFGALLVAVAVAT